MVFGLGFLGDMVHLAPALWMIRQAYPKSELHVGVAAHVASFLECMPWIDRVWGYSRFPKHASLKENLGFVARMRRERFDVLINLNGSDRSSWLTFFSGARERLGRMPRWWRPAVLAADVHRGRPGTFYSRPHLRAELPLPGKSRFPVHPPGISRGHQAGAFAGGEYFPGGCGNVLSSQPVHHG